MSESTPDVGTQAGDELLLELADDYLRRYRAGELPTADEYISKHPELADRIRELFPAMIAMEQSGPGANVDLAPPTERVGATIGRYKLLERIGEGGFGVVYMAEQQQPVRRKVALKIVKPGMDSRQILARFEAERQALAIMDHPNIAKIFDAGATDSARPYFVMELIRGEPITEFCDRNHLSPHKRLELFAQVCHAVQHAHQKGIIHRDIKPKNVLVEMHDTTPAVKVIDFGVAKALGQELTDKTLFTAFAQLLGTPLYMSPEQAGQSSLDIDTRSDVYSLGVLLYELLTGATPFDKERFKKAAHDEILRIIREEEPPAPSTRLSASKESLPSISAQRQTDPAKLTKLVRGELDWIVMKCLEKDRNRRYQTASGLAGDVERYLGDQPVEACPPSAAYRFRKFSRRNRAALATVALVAASLVLGTIVSTWQAIRATRAEHLAEARLVAETKARTDADLARAAEAEQRRLAEIEKSKAEEQRTIAEAERATADAQRAVAQANYQKVREVVDKYFTLVSESKLLDVPGLQPLRKELLEAALLFYQGSAVERTDDPAVLADLATTYLRIAVINITLDRSDDAVLAVDQALKVIDRLRSEFPDEHETLRRLGGFWKGDRPTQQSIELPKNQLVAFQTITRQIKTWESLASQFPDEISFRSDLAALYYLTGNLLASGGQKANGVHHFAKAKPLLVQLTQEFPNHPEYRADLARIHEQLARNLSAERAQEAEAESRAGLVLRDQLVAEFPESPQYRQEFGSSLRQYIPYILKRDPAEAAKLAHRHIEVAESLAREYPNVELYRSDVARAKQTWFSAVAMSGDQQAINEALPLLEELITKFSNDGDYQNLNDLAWSTSASVEVDANFADMSVRAAQRACELQPRWAGYLNTLGVAQYRSGDYAAAIESLGRSRALDNGSSATLAAVDCYSLAMAHAKLGQAEGAEKWFRAADLWMALFATDNAEVKRFRQEAIEVVGIKPAPIKKLSPNPEAEQELLRLCVAADPQGNWMHHWMGTRHAERRAWSEADEHLTQAAASLTENQIALFRHALVRLKLADGEGYCRACATMCERFGETEDLAESNTVAWTCGLGRDALADMSVPLSCAQKCAERGPEFPLNSCTLGLVLFRCGRYDDAELQFTKCIATLESHKDLTISVIYPRVLLAMTHWQLGHKGEARTWLSTARSGFDQEPTSGMTWNRRAIVELLLTEAEQMIPAVD